MISETLFSLPQSLNVFISNLLTMKKIFISFLILFILLKTTIDCQSKVELNAGDSEINQFGVQKCARGFIRVNNQCIKVERQDDNSTDVLYQKSIARDELLEKRKNF